MKPEGGSGRRLAAALLGLGIGAGTLAACGAGGPMPGGGGPASALMGQTAAQVQGALGAPELRRTEGQGELWQYRSGSCVFDVFLYEGRVIHTEARARALEGRDAVDASACMQSVRRA